ncbi:MAG TPA: tetratricopeptide repeat protein [Bacteroidales bacterium]|nr:tetratricopeptide repeat protein [Bacteroidales bacterium]
MAKKVISKKVLSQKPGPEKPKKEKPAQEMEHNIRYRIGDKGVFIGLIVIWGILGIFGIFTLMQPQWLIDLSAPGRTEEALTNITAGNSFLYQGKAENSELKFKKALENYQKALEIDPDNYEATANMGITYLYLNQLDQAKKTFEHCLKKDTIHNHHTYTYLADIYERQGEIAKALEYYQKSLEKHPNPAYPLRKAGLLSQRLFNSEDAIKYLKQSIEATNSFENEYRATLMDASYKLLKDNDTLNLAIIDKELKKNNYSEVLNRYDTTIFKQVLKNSKDLGYAYMYLADAYFSKTQFDSAYACYQKSSQYHPALIEKFKDKMAFASGNTTKNLAGIR